MHRAQSRVMNFMVQNVTEFRDVISNDNVYTSYLHMLRISFSKKQHMSTHIIYFICLCVFSRSCEHSLYVFACPCEHTVFIGSKTNDWVLGKERQTFYFTFFFWRKTRLMLRANAFISFGKCSQTFVGENC